MEDCGAVLEPTFSGGECLFMPHDVGRRLAVRTAMEHPISSLPRTPFPASRDFPSRGNEGHGEKNRRVIYFMYHSGVSPLWWLAAPKGGEKSHRRWLITVMLFMSYDTESKSRNADFISIARQGNPQPSAQRAVKLKNPWAKGPSILRTFSFTTLGAKPRQPSHRRCVQ